jgi:autophagy-related protein 101
VSCGNPEVEARIESKIATVQSWVAKNPGRHFQIRLGFFERRQQQGWLFQQKQQRLFWEQWIIPFSLQDSLQEGALESEIIRATRKQTLQQQIESCLQSIITAVNEKRNHIPPVVSENALTFPFEVTVEAPTSESSSVLGYSDIFKRMLSSTHPPSVLH